MEREYVEIGLHLGSALLAGSLIGLERSYHGRPAGFRTHALVCLASALLMVVTVYQGQWMTAVPLEAIRTDPTRMAQGIMTGIGFLGAGVIFKDGMTVRGLTTAASIWSTAALGILYGIGFYYPALLATGATLGTLAVFRWIEQRVPSQSFANLTLRYRNTNAPSEAHIREMLGAHGFTVSNVSYRLLDDAQDYEYRMVVKAYGSDAMGRLASGLRSSDHLVEFRLSPSGD